MATSGFFRQFIADRKHTGSVAPSSPFLVKKMLDAANVFNYNHIVELGPGTGVFTRALLQRMNPNAQVIAIEYNPVFCASLRKTTDPRLITIEGSALDITQILGEHHFPTTGMLVVSSLPLSNFTGTHRQQLLSTCKALITNGGTMVQYQYSRRNLKDFRSILGHVTVRFVLLNIPPAFVYKVVG
jgi:phospholipid N-methyltransferase